MVEDINKCSLYNSKYFHPSSHFLTWLYFTSHVIFFFYLKISFKALFLAFYFSPVYHLSSSFLFSLYMHTFFPSLFITLFLFSWWSALSLPRYKLYRKIFSSMEKETKYYSESVFARDKNLELFTNSTCKSVEAIKKVEKHEKKREKKNN